MSKENISHAAAVFPVGNVRETIDYYRDRLGFEITFEWENPVSYAVLKRGGGISIHFVQRSDEYEPSNVHTALYVFVNDVDRIYDEFKSRDVRITNEIGNRDYGMRDFDITDPNGFIICFSMSLDLAGN